MFVIKNANSKQFKINGKTVHGNLMAGTSPSEVTSFTEDAKLYKSRKGARVAILRLNREIREMAKSGALTTRSKNMLDALPDYVVAEPKGKRM